MGWAGLSQEIQPTQARQPLPAPALLLRPQPCPLPHPPPHTLSLPGEGGVGFVPRQHLWTRSVSKSSS